MEVVEVVCFRGGGGILREVNWSIDQAVEERGKVPQLIFFAVPVVTY